MLASRENRIPTLPQIDEKKKFMEVVDGDISDTVDVAIIRTMKVIKVLTSQELFIECVQQLQPIFNPKIDLVQKRIGDFISKYFLERDKEHCSRICFLPHRHFKHDCETPA